jgi:hypothetical protein
MRSCSADSLLLAQLVRPQKIDLLITQDNLLLFHVMRGEML